MFVCAYLYILKAAPLDKVRSPPSSTVCQVRMASIAVLKSTCFLASLHVRVKVAYFLGGVNGMVGLLQAPRNEAVLLVCVHCG